MKALFSYIVGCLVVLPCVCGCAGKASKAVVENCGDSVRLLYAHHFSIVHTGDYTAVTVFNPWKPGEVLDLYYLVKNDTVDAPADGRKVLIPVESLMVNSSTHLGFLELLGELPAVTGVCNADYIYNPQIREEVREGRVTDLGDSFNLNIEKLLMLRPQAVMTTAYNVDDANSKKMRKTGLTLIHNVEWQEKTLLGRAEWIKFVAAFFDKEALADSIFSRVEERYNEIRMKAAEVQHKPTVLSGQDYRGSWSMPGGQSFNARLFHDAGGEYFYQTDSTTGSLSTTIEEALLNFSKADVWVGVQAATLAELGTADSKYRLFKAFKEGRVYNTNKRTNATGGNDYWEGAVARPDLLLSDMIKVFHPDLLPDAGFTYLEKLTP